MYLLEIRGPLFYFYFAVYNMAASPPIVLENKCDRNLLDNIGQWCTPSNKSVCNEKPSSMSMRVPQIVPRLASMGSSNLS
jgi:hypothetical protein